MLQHVCDCINESNSKDPNGVAGLRTDFEEDVRGALHGVQMGMMVARRSGETPAQPPGRRRPPATPAEEEELTAVGAPAALAKAAVVHICVFREGICTSREMGVYNRILRDELSPVGRADAVGQPFAGAPVPALRVAAPRPVGLHLRHGCEGLPGSSQVQVAPAGVRMCWRRIWI